MCSGQSIGISMDENMENVGWHIFQESGPPRGEKARSRDYIERLESWANTDPFIWRIQFLSYWYIFSWYGTQNDLALLSHSYKGGQEVFEHCYAHKNIFQCRPEAQLYAQPLIRTNHLLMTIRSVYVNDYYFVMYNGNCFQSFRSRRLFR